MWYIPYDGALLKHAIDVSLGVGSSCRIPVRVETSSLHELVGPGSSCPLPVRILPYSIALTTVRPCQANSRARRRTVRLPRLCFEPLKLLLVADKNCSPLLRRLELGRSFRRAPPACRPPQDARPAGALRHATWHHPIHLESTESHTAVLARNAAQHTPDRIRLGHILLQPECAATTSGPHRGGPE